MSIRYKLLGIQNDLRMVLWRDRYVKKTNKQKMCNCLGLGQGSEKILLSFFSGLLTLSPCQFALGFYPLLFSLSGLFCLRRYSNFKLRISNSTPLAQTPLRTRLSYLLLQSECSRAFYEHHVENGTHHPQSFRSDLWHLWFQWFIHSLYLYSKLYFKSNSE